MIVLGLTGSIGMGKSTAARQLAACHHPVHDADAMVHALLAKGGRAVGPVARLFPDVVVDGAIDRQALGRRVFGDNLALKRLEAILHPLVRQAEGQFLRRARRQRRRLAVLDIPLLFEAGAKANRRIDKVAVVSCPAFLQAARVLRRPGMTPAKLDQIRRRQLPDAEKRRRADYLIPTGLGRRPALRRLCRMVKDLTHA